MQAYPHRMMTAREMGRLRRGVAQYTRAERYSGKALRKLRAERGVGRPAAK